MIRWGVRNAYCLFPQFPLVFSGFEIIFAHAAKGAHPVIGNVFKCCTWGNATVGVSCCGVIDVTADAAYILFHKFGYLRVNK